MERWLGKELPDHGVNLRYLGEDFKGRGGLGSQSFRHWGSFE